MNANPVNPRYVCNCKVCGKRYWSSDIVLNPNICIACWLKENE